MTVEQTSKDGKTEWLSIMALRTYAIKIDKTSEYSNCNLSGIKITKQVS